MALLVGKGAQQYEVMEHLGHTNIQTTINTYGHLFPSVRERIRVALEDTWEDGARTTGDNSRPDRGPAGKTKGYRSGGSPSDLRLCGGP